MAELAIPLVALGGLYLISNKNGENNPAWLYRDLEQNNFDILPLNPQENTCIPFQNNLNTRILERDYFTACKKFVN